MNFDRIIEDAFGSFNRAERQQRYEVVSEDSEKIVVAIDVPGVKREGLDIDVSREALVVKGTRAGRRDFTWRFCIEEGFDPDVTSATLADGVLTIEVGKRKPKNGSRKVPIG